jgi:hypothetical protein
MNYANYAAFRNSVQVMLDGDDISTSDLSVSVLDTIIGAGEQRIYREVRSSTQDTKLTGSTTSNLFALPSDFLELRGAPYVGTFVTAVYAPWEAVQNAINLQAGISTQQDGASPVYYTFQSDSILFYPTQADGTVITGQYYKRFSDISGGLNAFFTRHPDLFLYASLAESAPFLGEQERGPVWESKYASLVEQTNEQERRRYTRGGKLSTRVA